MMGSHEPWRIRQSTDWRSPEDDQSRQKTCVFVRLCEEIRIQFEKESKNETKKEREEKVKIHD
jgi:hypothetical protein